jgi:hypothetical protein
MKLPRPSWRPTTGQLTTTAIAVVCLLAGFWIGWQHRSSADPQTVTPSVPRSMRTKAVIIVPPTTTAATGTGASSTTTGAASGTTTGPGVPLPPRAQVAVAVLNAGGTPGAAVQIGVTLVQLGYPTPVTGDVSLPADLVPTATAPTPTPSTTTSPAAAPGATTPTTSTRATTATRPKAPPQVIYFRAGDEAIAQRLGADLGVSDIAPMPSTGVIQAAAPNAQLVVIVGRG